MAIARCCCLIAVVILLFVTNGEAATRRRRGHLRFPMPTKETLPYVAEVLGATSFEEITDDTSGPPKDTVSQKGQAKNAWQDVGSTETTRRVDVEDPVPQESKRVQRKLPPDEESSGLDNVSYMEYQGVMGRPGVDFPVLASIPRTDFSCREVKQSGYYADLHTGCQVFHICDGGRKISFLCPNGTIFRQSHLICDWWFRVDCGKSKEQYEESAELLAHDQMIYKKRAEELAKAMQQGESNAHEQTVKFVDPNPNPVPTTYTTFSIPTTHATYSPSTTTIKPKNHQSRRTKISHRASTRVSSEERQYPSESASFLGNSQRQHRFGASNSESISRNAYSGESYKNSVSSSTSAPVYLAQVQQSTTSKPVFTIRVKPNREFSFVELHKQDSKKVSKDSKSSSLTHPKADPYPNVQFVSSRTVDVTTPYAYTHTPSPRMQYSGAKTSKYNALSMNTKYSFSTGYSKNKINYSLATTELPPYVSNKTNDIEFIRPEMINSLMDTEVTSSLPKYGTPTPASSVNTLHSLASYYESAANDVKKELINLDSDHTKPPVSEILLRAHTGGTGESSEAIEEMMAMVTTASPEPTLNYSDTVFPSVLTKATQLSYSYLFKNEKPKAPTFYTVTTTATSSKAETTTESNEIEVSEKVAPERLVLDNSINDKDSQKSDDSKEIQHQRESADLRELAQVFTRALSAYLEDPESFKEILAQVRPTEPNPDVTTPSPEDEVLSFSDNNSNKNTKPQALPVTATTIRPFTPNDINNFIAAVTNIDSDNSLELSSSGVGSGSQEQVDFLQFITTAAPTSIAQDINSIAVNNSANNLASGEYFSSAQGSAEDNSYFPTAGGVTDGTRPRYGGFQNNTGNFATNRKYSRYGAELPPNITGAPLSEKPTIVFSATTPVSVSFVPATDDKSYQKIPEKLNLPDAYDVNNLAANAYFGPANKFNSEEAYSNHKKEDPLLQNDQNIYHNGGDQEKLLITAGTQSLFSANNYFNKVNGKQSDVQKNVNSLYSTIYNPISYQNGPPQQPSLTIQDQKAPESTVATTTLLGDYLEQTTFIPVVYQNNQNDGYSANSNEAASTIDPSFEQFTTDYRVNSFDNQDKPQNDELYRVQNVDLGNGVTLERKIKYSNPDAVWTNPTERPERMEDQDIPPTTYHPQHKIEPSVTTPNPFFIPPEPQLEQKAMEMFGGLNETATGKLMHMVDKAASNTTLRKLVLLLVSDTNKENLTVEESRSNLIQALLVNDDSDSSESNEYSSEGNSLEDSSNENDNEKYAIKKCGDKEMGQMEMSAAHSDRYHGPPCLQKQQSDASNIQITTQTPIETSSRMEFSVSSSSGNREEKISSKYSNGKPYRGTESQTGVVGSLQNTELNNRLNSAKLYIPSAPERKIPHNSDARAVELLKSLYNLAAKFG